MQLNSLTSKVTSNTDKIGYAVALFSPGHIEDIFSSIQQVAAGVIHPPTLTNIQAIVAHPNIRTAFMAWIGGELAADINVPVVGRIGKPIAKGAAAYAMAFLAIRMFYAMTHSEIKGENILNGSGGGSGGPAGYGY